MLLYCLMLCCIMLFGIAICIYVRINHCVCMYLCACSARCICVYIHPYLRVFHIFIFNLLLCFFACTDTHIYTNVNCSNVHKQTCTHKHRHQSRHCSSLTASQLAGLLHTAWTKFAKVGVPPAKTRPTFMEF